MRINAALPLVKDGAVGAQLRGEALSVAESAVRSTKLYQNTDSIHIASGFVCIPIFLQKMFSFVQRTKDIHIISLLAGFMRC